MSDLFITEQGCSIHKSGESLLLKKEGKQFFEIELKNVDTIQIFGSVQFSTQVAQDMMKRGIEFALYTMNGELLGQLTPPHLKNVELRFRQYELYKNESFCLDFSKEIIRKKFLFSIAILEKALRNRNLSTEPLLALKKLEEQLDDVHSIKSLLGVEGSFATTYFSLYSGLFSDPNVFQGRSKRPPKDAGNAVLSFLYVLMTNRIASYMDGIGFDPHIGFLHKMEYGRVSLGCDLVELVRSSFCDRVCLKLFNLGILSISDFEKEDDGGTLLNAVAKKKFFKVYGEESLAFLNYGFIRGTFKDFLIEVSGWLKKIILSGSVIRLEGKHE
jgi:CRISP-associated protein Cas1